MQITKQADYAVRAVLYLAGLSDGRRAPTSQIARDQKIPPSFLAKIVSQLSVAGMVQTSRGARGGVTLARDPAEISLARSDRGHRRTDRPERVRDRPVRVHLRARLSGPRTCGARPRRAWSRTSRGLPSATLMARGNGKSTH